MYRTYLTNLAPWFILSFFLGGVQAASAQEAEALGRTMTPLSGTAR